MRYNPLYFKTTTEVDVTPNGAGLFKLAINSNGSPNSNDAYNWMLTSTSYTPTVLSQFTSLVQCWSSVRLAAVKFRFIPKLMNDPSGTTIFPPLFGQYDKDGCEYSLATMNGTLIKRTSQFRVFRFDRQWKWFIRFPKHRVNDQTYVTNKLSSIQGSENFAGRFHDIGNATCDSTTANGYHVVLVNADATTPSVKYGSLLVTAYWVLRDRFD